MAELEKAWGYQGNNMNLPVRDIAAAVPFYEKMGFTVMSPQGHAAALGPAGARPGPDAAR